MLFLDDIKNITKESDSYKYIKKTMQNLEEAVEVQYAKKRVSIQILDKIANMQVEKFETINTDKLTTIISNVNEVLNEIRKNIKSYKKLLKEIKNIISRIDSIIDKIESDTNIVQDINDFYKLYTEKQNIIEKSNIKYEKMLLNIYKSTFSSAFSTENETEIKETIEQTKSDEEIKEDIEDNDTLIISETKNKVFLPYKISDLKTIVEQSQDKYTSINELIEEKYIIPLERYKNATFARFKEAYHLMRYKEKSSFTKALDLALEVTFKYNLNPAIITACKNLDEFDIYLDCLDENELDDFKIFNIKYEIAPIKA